MVDLRDKLKKVKVIQVKDINSTKHSEMGVFFFLKIGNEMNTSVSMVFILLKILNLT